MRKFIIPSLKLAFVTFLISFILCVPFTRGAEIRELTDRRYEVFFVGSFPGCSGTTLTFRPDDILVLECIDGFGIYSELLDSFLAAYWAPDYYLGKGIALFLSGMAVDSFIFAGGIAMLGNDLEPVLLTGYLLSTPN